MQRNQKSYEYWFLIKLGKPKNLKTRFPPPPKKIIEVNFKTLCRCNFIKKIKNTPLTKLEKPYFGSSWSRNSRRFFSKNSAPFLFKLDDILISWNKNFLWAVLEKNSGQEGISKDLYFVGAVMDQCDAFIQS